MKNKKKYILSIILFFCLFIATFYYIFSNYSFKDFMVILEQCQSGYLFLAFLMVFLFLFCHVLFLKNIFSYFQIHLSFYQTLSYVCTEIYYSAITPSSTGGQPVELYYMARDNIPYRVSTLVILIDTILYKLVILFLGVLSILLFPNLLLQNGFIFTVLLLLGVVLDIIVILFFSFLIFSSKIPQKIVAFFLSFLLRFHIVKKDQEEIKRKEFEKALLDYQKHAKFLRAHPNLFLKYFFLILVQRVSLFSIGFLVYKGFGLSGYTFLELLALQVGITLAIDSVPFPGGVMVGESLTYQINTLIYGEVFALSSMLLIRGISFYFLVLLSGLVYAIYHLFFNRKKVL